MCDNQCDFCNNSTPDQNMGSEEEAHYHWTLNEFQELLRIYGAKKVFGDLGTEFIIKITRELSNEQ